MSETSDAPVMVVSEDDVERALVALQEAILLHPAAAQGLFYALVEEGRRYSRTPEGADLCQRLARSELVVRARVLFDALTVRALEDNPETIVPTAVLEAITKAASDSRMEQVLEDLFIHNVFTGGMEAEPEPPAPHNPEAPPRGPHAPDWLSR